MRIEEEATLKSVLKSGVSLFLGAGFSVLSKDIDKINLPVGNKLLEELNEKFNYNFNNLSKLCTTLYASQRRDSYINYLTRRFSVDYYDELYNSLLKINLNNIYTTNIDNLVPLIWNKNENIDSYLNNTALNGESKENMAVNYYPLHGCVDNGNNEYIFSDKDISTAYMSSHGGWRSFEKTVSKEPVIFWGYSFADSDIIQSMYGNLGNQVNDNSKKWIILKSNDDSMIEYFKALNFSIIEADTKEFLEYISNIHLGEEQINNKKHNISKEFLVPMPNTKDVPVYPISNFFCGDIPRWSYIYSKQLIRTHHFKNIENMINDGNNLIVIGIPASGKSTLMEQLAVSIETSKIKTIMLAPTLEKAIMFKKQIKDQQVLLFVDDCLSDYRALIKLQQPNIQIVGFERDGKYESVVHRLNESCFKHIKYEVSEIDKNDIVRLVDTIPRDMYTGVLKESLADNTIFEVIRAHSKKKNIEDEFANRLASMYEKDSDATELFLLISYVHSCGVPVSYDMIYSYFNAVNYEEVYKLINNLGKMVRLLDNESYLLNDLKFTNQDYYNCRTRYIAELMITKIQEIELMKKVFWKFIQEVPKYKICRYDIFKRKAFDADLLNRFFKNYNEGIKFYEQCLLLDTSSFMYQQMALYASRKNMYNDAFMYIDKAKNFTKKNIFSIENTHAIILFRANINKESSDSSVIDTLHNSMEILQNCYKKDRRKSYHAIVFGEQIKWLYEKYGYGEVEPYVSTAITWLDKEILSDKTGLKSNKKMRRIKATIQDIIEENS